MLLKHCGLYATYRQWKQLNGYVRKGEHCEYVFFWKWVETESSQDRQKSKRYPVLKYYPVYHSSQVEGIEKEIYQMESYGDIYQPNEVSEVDYMIQRYLDNESIILEESYSDRACYDIINDCIHMPLRRQFLRDDPGVYYSSLFHEMGHSTGHVSRLNRKIGKRYGTDPYAREELVAEICASILMEKHQLTGNQTLQNSAAYVSGWSKRIRDNDMQWFIKAAAAAEKAANYIIQHSSCECTMP